MAAGANGVARSNFHRRFQIGAFMPAKTFFLTAGLSQVPTQSRAGQ